MGAEFKFEWCFNFKNSKKFIEKSRRFVLENDSNPDSEYSFDFNVNDMVSVADTIKFMIKYGDFECKETINDKKSFNRVLSNSGNGSFYGLYGWPAVYILWMKYIVSTLKRGSSLKIIEDDDCVTILSVGRFNKINIKLYSIN